MSRTKQRADYHRLHVRPFEPGIGALYLGPELPGKARGLFEEAEWRVASDAEWLSRVRTARLSLDCTKFMMSPGSAWFTGGPLGGPIARLMDSGRRQRRPPVTRQRIRNAQGIPTFPDSSRVPFRKDFSGVGRYSRHGY